MERRTGRPLIRFRLWPEWLDLFGTNDRFTSSPCCRQWRRLLLHCRFYPQIALLVIPSQRLTPYFESVWNQIGLLPLQMLPERLGVRQFTGLPKPVSEFYNGFAIGVAPIRRHRRPQGMLPVIKTDRCVVHVFPEVGFMREIISSNRICISQALTFSTKPTFAASAKHGVLKYG